MKNYLKLLGLPTIVTAAAMLSAIEASAVAVTDVTFEGEVADAATIMGGNDNEAGVNALGGDFAGDAWTLLDKTDEGSTEIAGVTFTIQSDPGTAGNFTLSWAETGTPGLPITMDFVVVNKAAQDWGAYLFEDETFTVSPTTGNGTFQITWLNNGGNTPDISHMSFYGRVADGSGVPEPSSLALLALGLAGVGFSRRMARK